MNFSPRRKTLTPSTTPKIPMINTNTELVTENPTGSVDIPVTPKKRTKEKNPKNMTPIIKLVQP